MGSVRLCRSPDPRALRLAKLIDRGVLDSSRLTDRPLRAEWCDLSGLSYTPGVSVHLFAGLRVRDFRAALPWYLRLLGEPTFFPHDTEAVWTLAEDRSVYVVGDADHAGHSVVTIFVDDLDARIAAIAACGIEPDEHQTYPNAVRKVVYHDPDGNELGFGGASIDAAT